jgi:hypothetical protein
MAENLSWSDLKNNCLVHKKLHDVTTNKQVEINRETLRRQIKKGLNECFSKGINSYCVKGYLDEVITKELTDNGFSVDTERHCDHFMPNDSSYTGCLDDNCSASNGYSRIRLV